VIAGVADTHAALWYLLGSPRLSAPAREFMDAAARAGDTIGLSAISLAEIVYLVEKNRIAESAYRDLRTALSAADCVMEEVPLTGAIVDVMRQVPRADVPDLPDRVVAATALHFEVPVISRDGRIRASAIPTIW
jgi:PIN domain nuclease of toxin-antitoxin system